MTARTYIFIVLFSSLAAACSQPGKITRVETTQYSFKEGNVDGVDSSMEKSIQPYRDRMNGQMSEVLAVSDIALTKGQPESLLGNLFSDACFDAANQLYNTIAYSKADFAFFNNGGLRAELPKGNITRGNIFELMPFDNELVVLNLSGGQVKKILESITTRGGVPVSHLQFAIKEQMPVDVMINGQPFDSTKNYKAITSDYLANGGDQYFFLTELKKDYLNLKIRDAMIRYFQQLGRAGKNITASLDNRISYVR